MGPKSVRKRRNPTSKNEDTPFGRPKTRLNKKTGVEVNEERCRKRITTRQWNSRTLREESDRNQSLDEACLTWIKFLDPKTIVWDSREEEKDTVIAFMIL
jgi:hypothetical protein